MKGIIRYIFQFIIGGSIIVGMSLLGTKVSTKSAAIFYVLPVEFTLASIFIYKV